MPTAVLTGCNSGIGNAFARVLIDEGYTVYATDVTSGPALQSLSCTTSTLDVRSPTSISTFVSSLPSDGPIDLLLNIAGVMTRSAADVLETCNQDVLRATFEVNTFGPFLLTQALLPHLLRSSAPKIGIISSRVGSMGDNSSGGSYAYRASKAAVNSIGRSLAMDLTEKGVVVALLHPGYVRTGMVPKEEMDRIPEAVEPEEAASKLWGVMKGKGLGETGRFWHREGYELPW